MFWLENLNENLSMLVVVAMPSLCFILHRLIELRSRAPGANAGPFGRRPSGPRTLVSPHDIPLVQSNIAFRQMIEAAG